MHAESGRKLSYGTLAEAAGKQTPAKDIPLKDPKDFALIGKPLKRLDTPDKTNGKAVYGIDAMLPGMKFANAGSIARCSAAKSARSMTAPRNKVPGVRQIVILVRSGRGGRRSQWAAKKGLDALVRDWDEGANANISSKDIWQHLRAASEKDGAVAKSAGDIAKGLATGERFDASSSFRFLRMPRWSR